MSIQDVNNFLKPSGGDFTPRTVLKEVGDKDGGQIVGSELRQMTWKGKPAWWPANDKGVSDPKIATYLTLRRSNGEEVEQEIAKDKRDGSVMQAVLKALDDAGVEGLEMGGFLALKVVSKTPTANGEGFTRGHEAKYVPPKTEA